jgi:hypothetical protein
VHYINNIYNILLEVINKMKEEIAKIKESYKNSKYKGKEKGHAKEL